MTLWISNKNVPQRPDDIFIVGNALAEESDFENRIINISLANWDLCPIEMNTLLKMCDDYYSTGR